LGDNEKVKGALHVKFPLTGVSLLAKPLSNDNCTQTGKTLLNVDIHRYKIL
jgi:hypothetical protein